jgi:hypothetical protein
MTSQKALEAATEPGDDPQNVERFGGQLDIAANITTPADQRLLVGLDGRDHAIDWLIMETISAQTETNRFAETSPEYKTILQKWRGAS